MSEHILDLIRLRAEQGAKVVAKHKADTLYAIANIVYTSGPVATRRKFVSDGTFNQWVSEDKSFAKAYNEALVAWARKMAVDE